ARSKLTVSWLHLHSDATMTKKIMSSATNTAIRSTLTTLLGNGRRSTRHKATPNCFAEHAATKLILRASETRMPDEMTISVLLDIAREAVMELCAILQSHSGLSCRTK